MAQFSHQNRTTDFALTQGTMYTAGGFYYQGGVDMDLVSQMSTFVVWGHNPIVSWPNAWHYIADAIENNDCKLIVVDPNKNTIGQKADLFVSLQPGTDAALALGLAKIIEEEGKTDDAFMQQKSCAPFLVKESDGRFLRKSDLEEGVAADADDFAVWDEATNAMGYASTAQNPVLRKKGIEVARPALQYGLQSAHRPHQRVSHRDGVRGDHRSRGNHSHLRRPTLPSWHGRHLPRLWHRPLRARFQYHCGSECFAYYARYGA